MKNRFTLLYSPRTTYSRSTSEISELYTDLTTGFDPYTIKILKRHLKERLGSVALPEFICILKNHLLGFHPDLRDRENKLIQLLYRLFDEIDLNNNGVVEWNEFINYIINCTHKLSDNPYLDKLRHYHVYKQLSSEISYAFTIKKYNLTALVTENRSVVSFYGPGNFTKRCQIELKELQKDIDEIEMKELNRKAELALREEEREKREQKAINELIHEKLVRENTKKNPTVVLANINRQSIARTLENVDLDVISNSSSIAYLGKSKKKIKKLKIVKKGQNPEENAFTKKFINKKLTVLTSIFLEEFDVLLISATNNKISAWKYEHYEFKNCNTPHHWELTTDYQKLPILSTEMPQHVMAFDTITHRLYTGQPDGDILEWSLTSQSYLDILSYHKTGSSRDSVSCLILVPKMQTLVAGYYNGRVIIWDTVLRKPRRIYCDQETGIYQMLYDTDRFLIFTCGFDHDIHVYDPYVEKNAVYKLTGHKGSICSISIDQMSGEMVSIDILGIIKMWDLNTFKCFQNININETEDDNQKDVVKMANKKKISSNYKLVFLNEGKFLVYGDRFLVYQKGTTDQDSTDDQLILGCYYNPTAYELTTLSLKRIRKWCIFTGKIKELYENLLNGGEISVYSFDQRMKRIYIGETSGRIRNYNMNNGEFIKEFQPCPNSVNFLLHYEKKNIVIAVVKGGIIRFYDESELTTTSIIKDIKIEGVIKAIALDEDKDMLSMGMMKGNCLFYDTIHYRFESDLDKTEATPTMVTTLCLIDNTDIIFVGYETGRGKFLTTSRNPFRYKGGLLAFSYIDMFDKDYRNTPRTNQRNRHRQKYPITALHYEKTKHLLFIGNSIGMLNCYDTSEIVKMNETGNYDTENNCCKVLWCSNLSKQAIVHLSVADLIPMIVVSTCTDRKVRLFDAMTGEFIDELRQKLNVPPVPTAIRFQIDNPFLEQTEKEDAPYAIVSREGKVIEDDSTKLNNQPKASVLYQKTSAKDLVIAAAKDKLAQYTKKSNLPPGRSTKWNYMTDLDNIEKKYNETLNDLKGKLKEKEVEIELTEQQMQKMSIFHKDYKPVFISSMSSDDVKNFSDVISDKIRNVKLSSVKSSSNMYRKKTVETFSNQNPRLKLDKSKLLSCRQKSTFETMRSDFDNKFNELRIPLVKLKKKMVLPKIK